MILNEGDRVLITNERTLLAGYSAVVERLVRTYVERGVVYRNYVLQLEIDGKLERVMLRDDKFEKVGNHELPPLYD